MFIEHFKISAFGSGSHAGLRTYILDSPESAAYGRKPMVFICPGGGYEFISSKEGEPLAMQFAAMGYHTAVMTYSVKPALYPVQLLEVAQAWKIIREHAEAWNVQADKIIILGCSAGGHLAASYSIFCGEKMIMDSVGLSADELRPAGMILCYPVISSGRYAHQGSFAALLGKDYEALSDNPLLKKLSLEKQVTDRTPPTFIWHTCTDNVVPVENALLFALALKEKNISCELHIFPEGGHGLALANEFTRDKGGYGIQDECRIWVRLAQVWMNNQFGFGEPVL